nr:hypothetical protein [Caballeronia insecticola]
MIESEMGIALRQFFPQLPHAEITFAHADVIKKHDAAIRPFRKPRFEIVFHRFVGMKTVNMQKVDHRRRNALPPHRKSFASTCVQIRIDVVGIKTCVFIALPCIHRMTAGLDAMLLYCLTERSI